MIFKHLNKEARLTLQIRSASKDVLVVIFMRYADLTEVNISNVRNGKLTAAMQVSLPLK
jgi:hypothetical protein